jgi:hypothetical protein
VAPLRGSRCGSQLSSAQASLTIPSMNSAAPTIRTLGSLALIGVAGA